MTYLHTHTAGLRLLTCAIVAMLAALCLQSCFTGIESTPAITRRDVARRGAADVALPGDTAAVTYGEAPRLWRHGKEFYVTDSRIGALFKVSDTDAPHAGDTLRFVEFRPAVSVTGAPVTDLILTGRRGSDIRELSYRLAMDDATIAGRHRLAIPYTVEMSVVREADAKLTGRTMYILTPVWNDSTGTPVADGLRMVPVLITGVTAGTESTPLLIHFTYNAGTDGAVTQARSVYSRADDKALSRIFSAGDPRAAHPEITDEVWALITSGRVRPGMTRAECRLALDAPDDIERGYGYSSVHERWSYASGLYLIFTDDILTSTNR